MTDTVLAENPAGPFSRDSIEYCESKDLPKDAVLDL